MGKKNSEVDEYIADSADFARPILKKLRALYHKACPQIEESIKWGDPHFEYKGVVGSMAAFKQHAGFGFWKGEWVTEAKQEATRERRLATALEWLADGKSRNWKYECK
jgi:hypothetical protein